MVYILSFSLTWPENVMSVDRQIELLVKHFMKLQVMSPKRTNSTYWKVGGAG